MVTLAKLGMLVGMVAELFAAPSGSLQYYAYTAKTHCVNNKILAVCVNKQCTEAPCMDNFVCGSNPDHTTSSCVNPDEESKMGIVDSMISLR
ncbi:hypothetical protein K1X76_09990 [bacterium]|nr:hypothetical protein [bacterium]